MRPSISCFRHHCRTVYNPSTYDVTRSYQALPFRPKSLFFPHTIANKTNVAVQLQMLKRLDPGLQIVTACLDLKHNNAYGEMWFDEFIKINSFRPFKKDPVEGDESDGHLRMIIHDKKIDLSFIHMFIEEQRVNIYFKQPHKEFTNLLRKLEIELPFDKKETTFTSKSQFKAISGKLRVNEVCEEDYLIQKLNSFNAGLLFKKLVTKSEEAGKDYRYLLETNENGERNRFRIYDQHLGTDDLGLLIDSEPPAVGTYCQIFQLCLEDLYQPKITDGFLIEKHRRKKTEIQGQDIVLENVLSIGDTSGFTVDGRDYIGLGDHIKIETKTK